ncbi:hypothetical protein HMF7854_03230 [Sphingomonas ginkgonis]|uniref:Thioredoxin-like fold domain-containing protein n=1 Tax=Sphingomonas ginkgonis TaxID=2315330 RepID=A0A3R9YKN3_9SPHN|nr:thioredoxin domain-containing protein [Sphingomonas ginkgonis]RST29946.1 hypothetical protein HMF7854_03230 [Sphingomonas ginkgonis]
MKFVPLMLAATAILASSACNKKGGDEIKAPNQPVAAVKAPNGDWSQVTAMTPEGGVRMGNPNAAVKLVEYGSLTCPHCAEFAKTGEQPLIDNYVKSGRVSWEFRNFVRDPLDMTLSLVARCAGPQAFFKLSKDMYTDQPKFFDAIQKVSEAQQQQVAAMQPAQQFAFYAQNSGLTTWAAMHGLPSAKVNACLGNQRDIDKLAQMNPDAVAQYNIPGTPAFLINNVLVQESATWEALEPKLKKAVGG